MILIFRQFQCRWHVSYNFVYAEFMLCVLLIPEPLELFDFNSLLGELGMLLFSKFICITDLLFILIKACDPSFFLALQVVFCYFEEADNISLHL